MSETNYKIERGMIQLNGTGLLSESEVNVLINKGKSGSGIIFFVQDHPIKANLENVSSTTRNTVLSNSKATICLVEHFLAACSVLGINDIEVTTNKSELVFNDGSSFHWYELFKNSDLCIPINEKYKLTKTIFLKSNQKNIVAIPSNTFKASYFMDWDHTHLGKLWATWNTRNNSEINNILRLLRARTFATKAENDFFGNSCRLLTLDEKGFNKKLHEPLEPVYHKILDLIGDLRLCGVNPLEIKMHVIGFKSGHTLNIELARELTKNLS